MFDVVQFLSGEPAETLFYPVSYRLDLIAISALLAVFSSYVALITSNYSERSMGIVARAVWSTISAVVMGFGIWGMHFVGMLALSIPVQVIYDSLTTLLSVLPAIFASAVALGITRTRYTNSLWLLIGAILLGTGIGVMHYLGMAAMQFEGILLYDRTLFFISIFVAVILSYLALRLRIGLKDKSRNVIVALVIGLAISAMHHVAMAATHFLPSSTTTIPQAAISTDTLMVGIVIFVLLLALLTLAFSTILKRRDLAVANEDFLRHAFNQHAIVSITDTVGDILYVNDKFCQISGYDEEELYGQNHRIIKSTDQLSDDIYTMMWRTITAGKTWRGELCNTNKAGKDYWVSATLVPQLDAHGKPWQYVSFYTDITDHKHDQLALLRAKNSAEAANSAKSEFLSSMSHELRTPMNSILGFGQLMEYDETLPAEHQDNVHEILKAGHHLLSLINEVLDLAKVESGNIVLSLEAVELTPVIEECFSLISILAERRDIHLHHNGSAGATVLADRMRLKQALLNLLSNAIKYNREGGDVTLTVESGSLDQLRIRITDTGEGIPSEGLAELFQPFNRLDAENSKIEGTGIGLTITRRIIELMDGTVNVESEVGVGSSFWIELPLVPLSETDQEYTKPVIDSVTSISQAEKNQHTLLYIEDNPSNIKLMTQTLSRRKDIHLLTAHTPELGIELARSHQPHLILLDINMPGMDGYQVLEVFKADILTKKIPIIAVTANAMPRDIKHGMTLGFSSYITKPIDIGQLITQIDRTLQDYMENDL